MEKQLRLISFFSGYDSQSLALKYLGIDFEHWKTCEWAVKSIQALKDLHFADDTTDYSKDLSKDELIRYLSDKGISSNYNEPMSFDQIKRLDESKLRTIYNNIKAIHNLVNIQQVKGEDLELIDTDKYDYLLTYSYPCVTKNTLVLSEKGYVPFRELNIGDKVLTKSNTWQKVVKQFDNGVAAVYRLESMGTAGIECTQEHKFYAREMYRKGHKGIRCFKEPTMVHAKDLTKKHYLGIPIIQDEIPFYTDDVNFWYLIGMYLGDGWLNNSSKDIRFGFNDKKIELFDKLGYKYSIYNNSIGCKHVRINCKDIYKFIESYIGAGSGTKHIPIEILKLPKKQLQALYDGYLATNGCVIKNKHQFSSVNESMSYSVVSIIHKLYNRPVSIYKIKVKPTKIIQGREINQQDWYQIRFKLDKCKQDRAFYDDGYIWFPFKSLTFLREDNVYNMEIENDHSYIINGVISANCQDLSLAGLGKGMEEGSGTRSSMLWEVKRILAECKELGALPKYLLLENVPQAHGVGNLKSFNDWCDFLKSIGYTNTWTDLNAKNYGIPQNRERCFMVSELDADGVYFKFPEKMKLALRLKDMLEEKVDEKYYLSDKIISKLAFDKTAQVDEKSGVDLCDTKSEFRDISNTIKSRYDCGYEHFSPGPTGVVEPQLDVLARTENGNNFNAIYSENGISPTLLARDYKDPVRVAELKQVAQMYPNNGNPQAGRVYDKGGLSPCLDTCQGGNREVKIVEDNYVGMYNYALSDTFMGDKDRFQEGKDIAGALLTSPKEGVVLNEPRICASRGRNPENPNSRESGEHTEQRLELGPDGLSNTLTTVQKDNYLVEPQLNEDINVVGNYKPSGHSCGRVITTNGISPTVMENHGAVQVIIESQEDNLKRQLCNKLIEENKVKEGDIIRHSYTNSRFDSFHIENEENHDCCATLTTRPDCIGYVEKQENKPCPTLDTRCDCLGVVVNEDESLYSETEKQLFTEDGNIKRYLNSDIIDKFEEGQMATTSYPNGYGHGSRTHNESISLNTIDKPSVKQNLRIRKLTPKECFRLMGVKDEDFEKIAKNQSNASLYHLAGDSIVTTCLMVIFGKLFNVKYREKVKELLKDIKPNFDWDSIEPEVIHEKANIFDNLFD